MLRTTFGKKVKIAWCEVPQQNSKWRQQSPEERPPSPGYSLERGCTYLHVIDQWRASRA